MKTLYLDCGMGAAGDMLTAALLELLPDPDAFVSEMNALGIPGVTIKRLPSSKCGVAGTHVSVTVNGCEEGPGGIIHEHDHGHNHEHSHSNMRRIEQVVEGLRLPEKVHDDVLAVYRLIAEAESRAHGVPVSDIHFHEVGAMDAVADITSVCMLMHRLAPERVAASPVHVGGGYVHCAHGILPVPAPATAFILRGVPYYGGGSEDGELCTPTGAALLRHFVTGFGPMPLMRVDAVGYGMGQKDFAAMNCVRAMLGETEERSNDVLELCCTVDDMTAEVAGFAMERFFDAGALEVYTIPAGMKKSRPGMLISVICRPEDRELMVGLMMKHTSTLGVRGTVCRRYAMERRTETEETPLGPVRRKVSRGYGAERAKYEFEDVARAARENGLSFADALRAIEGR